MFIILIGNKLKCLQNNNNCRLSKQLPQLSLKGIHSVHYCSYLYDKRVSVRQVYEEKKYATVTDVMGKGIQITSAI